MPGRLLFVCAQGSSRALLAASLLHARAADRWEVWCTPTADQHGYALAEQVLREQGSAPLAFERLIHPTSGMVWEEVIILCSGATDS
jgi:protein-tyrosine-phosphatase